MTETNNPLWLPDGRLNLDAVDRRRFTVTTDAATGRTLVTPNVKIPSHPGETPHAPRVPFTRTELWRDEGELWLRSIVVDADGRVVSVGFPKFFELVEVPEMEPEIVAALKESKAWISPKLDGTLAIATLLPDGSIYWRTRCALDFSDGYKREYRDGLDEAREKPLAYIGGLLAVLPDGYMTADDIIATNGAGWSFLFELTGPCNEMAVVRDDGGHALTLLAAVRHPMTPHNVMPMLEHVYPKMPQRWAMRGPDNISIGVEPGTELDLIRNGGESMGEGFVIIMPDGRMVKVKTEWYMRLHHLLDRMTPGIIGRIVAQRPNNPEGALKAEGYDPEIHARAYDLAAAYMEGEHKAVADLCGAADALCAKINSATGRHDTPAAVRLALADMVREVVADMAAYGATKALRKAVGAALFAILDGKSVTRFALSLALRLPAAAVPDGAELSTESMGHVGNMVLATLRAVEAFEMRCGAPSP